MKRSILCLSLALCIGAATPSLAQQDLGYEVQPGDTLYDLSGQRLGDPEVWQNIVDANPFLRDPGRWTNRNGKTVVIIRPHERLQGLEQYGVVATPEEPQQADPVYVVGHRPTFADKVAELWWILPLAILALLIFLWRMLNADPVRARRPQVPDGVNDETVGERFGAMGRLNRFQILEGSLRRGRIWGIMNVRYGDGSEVPRRLNGQAAYSARVRHSDGREEELYMLQACGNDLRFGGISRYIPGAGFRFEPDEVLPATPSQKEPTVEAAAPAEASSEAANEPDDGSITIVFEDETADQPALLRAQGVDVKTLTCTRKDRSVTIRFSAK